MEKYSHTYSIILDNMDMREYRISPLACITYVQDAFARFTATKKIAAYDLFAYNLYWIIKEIDIDFDDEMPFWSEEIKVEIWFSKVSKLNCYSDFFIYYKDKVFAKGNTSWYLISTETKRPAQMSLFQDKITQYDVLSKGEHKKFISPQKKELFFSVSHKINYSDIDFNNHVNNKSYINLARMTIPQDFDKDKEVANLKVKFSKETFLDDTLLSSTYKTDDENVFVCEITKDENVVCEVVSTWKTREAKEEIINANTKIKNFQ